MKKFKEAMRLVGIGLIILLAVCGVGFVGLFPTRREQDYDNEIKTEVVEGKEDKLSDTQKN